MSELSFAAVQSTPLAGLTLKLDAGIHWVHSDESPCAAHLINLAYGAAKPRHGTVTLDGVSVRSRALVQAQIGALPAEISLPRESVKSLLTCALALKRSAVSADDLLADWDLSTWATRLCNNLSVIEARALALVIALATPNAQLLALYDPFLLGLSPQIIRRAVEAAASAGAVVLIATHSGENDEFAECTNVGQYTISAGHLLPRQDVDLHDNILPRTNLTITCENSRALAKRLSVDPRVITLNFDETATPGHLRITGTDAVSLGLAVGDAALLANVMITHMCRVAPSQAENL